MLKITTINGSTIRLTPAKDRITIKNSVDSPIMTARVPIMENRSFHMLMDLTSKIFSKEGDL
jgi:hypothetical protein